MKYITLDQHATRHLTGFNTYAELKAARDRAKAKQITVVFWGEASKVKEWQAVHWVSGTARYKDYGDGLGLLVSGPGKTTALESLRSAAALIGSPAWILIFKM